MSWTVYVVASGRLVPLQDFPTFAQARDYARECRQDDYEVALECEQPIPDVEYVVEFAHARS